MTTEDFKQLEQLLGKLGGHLGHRFCLVPKCVHDGYHIGVYGDSGDIKASDTWTDLETTTKRVIKKITTNKLPKTCLNGINTLGFGHWCAVCNLTDNCDIFKKATRT